MLSRLLAAGPADVKEHDRGRQADAVLDHMDANMVPPAQPRGARARSCGRRPLALAFGALVFLAAAGYGAYSLSGALTKDQSVLVLTDATAEADTSTTFTTTTSTTTQTVLDARGLWAGNVRTVPERPASLPGEFYEKPASSAQLMTGEPLWIFAEELSTEEAAAAVDVAPEEQSILIFDPSEELCQALGVVKGMRPSFLGELPAIFTQTPVLSREKVFAEVPPNWLLFWAELGDNDKSFAGDPDPKAVLAAAATWTMRREEQREGLKENQEAQSQTPETTPTTDLYPIERSVESKQAETLAQNAAKYLASLTGETFAIEGAREHQMLGPNDALEHRGHGAALVNTITEERLTYSVFWSDIDQMGGAGGESLSPTPTAFFEAADGSRGYIQLARAARSFYCRLQLKNGVTAYTDTGTISPNASTASPVLTAQQVISFTEWLAEQGEYLRP